MGEKLVLDDAGSSSYVVFGSLLGSWDTGCACMGCGEDGEDLACKDNGHVGLVVQ